MIISGAGTAGPRDFVHPSRVSRPESPQIFALVSQMRSGGPQIHFLCFGFDSIKEVACSSSLECRRRSRECCPFY